MLMQVHQIFYLDFTSTVSLSSHPLYSFCSLEKEECAPELECTITAVQVEAGERKGARCPQRFKGLFGELPWWSLDAGRQSSELAAAGAHGREGWAARIFNP